MAIAFGLGAFPTGSWERRHRALGLRAVRRPDLPDLGRNIQPVPVDLHGYVRAEIRNGELEPALYREGTSAFLSRLPLDQGIDRVLGTMVFAVTAINDFVVVAWLFRAQAAAGAGDGAKA